MELVVRKTDLLRELQLFQGIVERKNTIPILANVLLEAKGEEVKLLATDLEVGLRSRCAASVAKSGSLTLPAKKLYEIIKALPETDVRIEEDKNGVKVAADRFDSRMQTLPREDFPTVPEASGTYSAALQHDVLKQMVGKTQFAITGEDTRYFLNGALFILRPDSMSLVSTDGHRLALVTVPREKAKGKKGKYNLNAEEAQKYDQMLENQVVKKYESVEWVPAAFARRGQIYDHRSRQSQSAGPEDSSRDPVQRYLDEVIVHGSPARVIDELDRLYEEMHLDYLLCAPLSHQSFILFTEQVLPAIGA